MPGFHVWVWFVDDVGVGNFLPHPLQQVEIAGNGTSAVQHGAIVLDLARDEHVATAFNPAQKLRRARTIFADTRSDDHFSKIAGAAKHFVVE